MRAGLVDFEAPCDLGLVGGRLRHCRLLRSGGKLFKALRDFACDYADQTQADYQDFMGAIRSRKIRAGDAKA